MYDIWLEISDDIPEFRQMSQIAKNPFSAHTKITAFDTQSFNGSYLLRDKRSIFTVFASCDYKDSHKHLASLLIDTVIHSLHLPVGDRISAEQAFQHLADFQNPLVK